MKGKGRELSTRIAMCEPIVAGIQYGIIMLIDAMNILSSTSILQWRY